MIYCFDLQTDVCAAAAFFVLCRVIFFFRFCEMFFYWVDREPCREKIAKVILFVD